MIRLLLTLLWIAIFGLAGAWMTDHPGSVVISWLEYRIDTSFAFLCAIVLGITVIIAYIVVLVRRLFELSSRFSERRTLQHYEMGLSALTNSVAALASSDLDAATKYTRKAEKMLGRTPLILLLNAQLAKSKGDDNQTRALLQNMLDYKETEYLAACNLSEAACKEHAFDSALVLAERAQSLNAQATENVVGLQLRLGQWQQALAAIKLATRGGRLSRSAMKRLQGITYLVQGQKLLDDFQNEGALYAARHALKNLPDFTPAIQFAIKAYNANDYKRKANKLRATLPPTESVWTCRACGHSTNSWLAHCPSCEVFDTLG